MINVAIDGPSGAGKSTISKRVAKMLGYIYMDTGAMYRSLAYKAIQNGIDIKNNHGDVIKMLESTVLEFRHGADAQLMFVDGEDVTAFIRTPEVSIGASNIAVIPEVRIWLLEKQKSFARENNCIMDGRDIGTCVLPNAEVKIFLTASCEARAQRRLKELLEKGEKVTFDEVLEDMKYRDKNDSSRDVAPLKPADDAYIADTSELDFESSVELIQKIIKEKVSKLGKED